MRDPVFWTVSIISSSTRFSDPSQPFGCVSRNFLCRSQLGRSDKPLAGPRWASVEGVLVLHCSGPASSITVVVVIGRAVRCLQQTLRAGAPTL